MSNKMTFGFTGSKYGNKSLSLAARSRDTILDLGTSSILALCSLRCLLARIKSRETSGWRHKDQRIRKSDHVTRVPPMLNIEFPQLELQQAHIDDITGYA